jgi:hypothetical protein
MNLYIDANIFLDFYRLPTTDIEELKKLVVLIDGKQINLLMPQQTLEEINRNRDKTVFTAMKSAKDESFSLKGNYPEFLKLYDEHGQILALLREVNSKHAMLMKKADETISAKNLDADVLINNLLAAADKLETTPEIFNKAINRFRRGNPPGKNKNSVGDEINWETLKASVKYGEDIFLVSRDLDYKSAVGKGEVNSFLKSEWEKDKNSKLNFFDTLAGFFKAKYPDIKIAADLKAKILIERLSQSGSFATTHACVGALMQMESFNNNQAKELIQILELNQQVRLILIDDDVNALYRRIAKENGNEISEDARATLERLLEEVDIQLAQVDGPDFDDDEPPY